MTFLPEKWHTVPKWVTLNTNALKLQKKRSQFPLLMKLIQPSIIPKTLSYFVRSETDKTSISSSLQNFKKTS